MNGYLDALLGDSVHGWAEDGDGDGTVAAVAAMLGSDCIGTGRADQPRADIGRAVGYRIELQRAVTVADFLEGRAWVQASGVDGRALRLPIASVMAFLEVAMAAGNRELPEAGLRDAVGRMLLHAPPAEAAAPTPAAPADTFDVLLRESGLFDAEWYLAQNVDLRRARVDPWEHFVLLGAGEGRNPGPGFDTQFYLEQYPEAEASELVPVEHYLRIGRPAGFEPRGATTYARWADRFQDLNAADRARIAADAADLPRVACIRLPAPRPAGAGPAPVPAQVGVEPDWWPVAGDGEPGGAARAIMEAAAGSVVVLAADEAILQPHACYVFTRTLSQGAASMAYSDHDQLAGGERTRPVLKPAMSPDFMARQPYAGPVAAVRLDEGNRALVAAAVGRCAEIGCAEALAGLLLAADPARVARIPLSLYTLPAADAAGEERPALDVHQYEPIAEPPRGPAAPPPADLPRVDILVPTRDRRELVEECVASILAVTDYPRDRMRVVVIDNGSTDPATLAFLDAHAAAPQGGVVRSPGPFNFARICNDGVAATDGEVVLFLNNDTAVRQADWLRTLAATAMRPEIGVVGAQLLYPDDTVQHGGTIVGLGGVAGHRLLNVSADDAARVDATREMTAVTGACLAIRRAVFTQIGGFDPVLSVAFNDVALCLDVVEAGYRNIYVAEPLLYHYESKSRGFDDTRAKQARNIREAVHTRERHDRFFRDDPSYNPNLSLARTGVLAVPPRTVLPWRRGGARPRILLLSLVHGIGHGVGCVVAKQAEFLQAQGWDVTVGGPRAEDDRAYPGCRRVRLAGANEAAALAVAEGFDCVIAHTLPFFSVGRLLGRRPLFYIHDHGEPPPALFPDREMREDQYWEKRFCAPLARRVFTISQAILDGQFTRNAIVLRNGNTHLAAWSPEWAARRAGLRRRWGLEGRFVVLNVCRFHRAERAYKGVEDYLALAAELPFAAPALAGRPVFVLAGRGDEEDVAWVAQAGILVFPNVSDDEMAELYAVADLYVNLSQWEGYNLGIGQALAMGLEVVASDIPAHREFGVPVAGTLPRLCGLVAEAAARHDRADAPRHARLEPWDEPLARMEALLRADLAEDAAGPWL